MRDEEYEQLYKKGFARTCAVFHKLGYSPEDCQDLAQEVYLEIWRDAKARARAEKLLNLWYLKVALIVQRARRGDYSNPLDTLISIRNIEESPHLGGSTRPLDEDEEIVYQDFLSGLPKHLQAEIAGLLQGATYAERRKVSKLRVPEYAKLREELMFDPRIQEYINKYLRR